MVAAKLDHSGVLVTKFRQNWLRMKGRSAGQRPIDRQTRVKIRALHFCNRAKKLNVFGRPGSRQNPSCTKLGTVIEDLEHVLFGGQTHSFTGRER